MSSRSMPNRSPDGGGTTQIRLAEFGFVALGGALGSAARFSISTLIREQGDWPLSTLCVNLTGAFLLGVLLTAVATTGRGASARLLLGTGVLGGFTTYSLLATEVAQRLLAGNGWVALGYGATTLVGGALLSGLGIALGRRLNRSSSSAPDAGGAR